MSDRRTGQRAGALVLAAVFFFSSAALTGYVIWQIKQNNSDAKTQKDVQAALEKAQAEQNTAQDTNKKEGGTKLEGTKLEGFTPVATVDTLQVVDVTEGTGDTVKEGDTITAHYTGALAKDGTIFQSSHDGGQPFTSPLSGLIAGWQQGIPGMKVGGKRRLLIPAAQAYGSQAQNGIPANSDLVFDIELVSVTHP